MVPGLMRESVVHCPLAPALLLLSRLLLLQEGAPGIAPSFSYDLTGSPHEALTLDLSEV